MKTSVVLHEDVGEHLGVERRPSTQRGGNRACEERRQRRHQRRKERRDAQGDARGQQRKSGADARAARRKQGGGGLSHLDRGAFSANSSAPPGSKHTMMVSKKPQSVV